MFSTITSIIEGLLRRPKMCWPNKFVSLTLSQSLVCTSNVVYRNWVFAKNLNALIPLSLQPGGVNLWYFQHRVFDLTEYTVLNMKGLRH